MSSTATRQPTMARKVGLAFAVEHTHSLTAITADAVFVMTTADTWGGQGKTGQIARPDFAEISRYDAAAYEGLRLIAYRNVEHESVSMHCGIKHAHLITASHAAAMADVLRKVERAVEGLECDSTLSVTELITNYFQRAAKVIGASFLATDTTPEAYARVYESTGPIAQLSATIAQLLASRPDSKEDSQRR